ncbi:MAG: HAMP domain-containing protein [Nitrospirota bacterium]
MKISARLLLGFAAVIFVVIVFSITVFLSVRELTSYIGGLNELGQHQAMAGNLRFNVTLMAMPAYNYVITGKKEEHIGDFRNQASIVEEKLRDIEAADLTPEERKIVREIKSDYEEIKRLTQAIFNIASPIGKPQAMRLMEEMDYKYVHPASEKATKLFDIIKEKREKVRASAKKVEKRVMIVFTAGVLITFLISSVIAFVIARSISRPLGEMAALSQKIAQGDLDVAIETKRMDEIGVLAGDFNKMAVNLKNSQMEQRRLFEGEQRKVQQMAVLHEAVAAIASHLEVESLLEHLSSLSALLVEAELSGLVILHPETGAIQYFKANISPDDFPVKTMPKGKGLLGAVLRGSAPIRLADASADPRFEGLPSGHPFIKGFLGVPMLLKDKVIGGIFAANKKDNGHFT